MGTKNVELSNYIKLKSEGIAYNLISGFLAGWILIDFFKHRGDANKVIIILFFAFLLLRYVAEGILQKKLMASKE